MVKLGIVSTGWISGSFAEGCLRTGLYRVTAVCSRKREQAEAFGKTFGASHFFSDVRELADCRDVDAVYIASPNSLHYQHCLAVLRAGKHAIVEKPAFSNISQANEAFALAQEKGVLLFEAMRSIHEANHRIVKEAIRSIGIGPLCGASLSYMKRSPRYDLVLAGEAPNVFSLQYSGGALMDLGIYLLYDALDWFGTPLDASYHCQKARTGVDIGGIALLNYRDFNVTLDISKICNSKLACEIRGRDKLILLDAAQNIKSIRIVDLSPRANQSGGGGSGAGSGGGSGAGSGGGTGGGTCVETDAALELAGQVKENWMEDEALCFARLIGNDISVSAPAPAPAPVQAPTPQSARDPVPQSAPIRITVPQSAPTPAPVQVPTSQSVQVAEPPASYESLKKLSLEAHALMTKLRLGAGIIFPAD